MTREGSSLIEVNERGEETRAHASVDGILIERFYRDGSGRWCVDGETGIFIARSGFESLLAILVGECPALADCEAMR